MRYEVRIADRCVAVAWSFPAARAKAMARSFDQAELQPSERVPVSVWRGGKMLTEFGPVMTSEDEATT